MRVVLCVAGIGGVPVLAGLLPSEVSVAKGKSKPGPKRFILSSIYVLFFERGSTFTHIASRDRVSSRRSLARRHQPPLSLHFGGRTCPLQLRACSAKM